MSLSRRARLVTTPCRYVWNMMTTVPAAVAAAAHVPRQMSPEPRASSDASSRLDTSTYFIFGLFTFIRNIGQDL